MRTLIIAVLAVLGLVLIGYLVWGRDSGSGLSDLGRETRQLGEDAVDGVKDAGRATKHAAEDATDAVK